MNTESPAGQTSSKPSPTTNPPAESSDQTGNRSGEIGRKFSSRGLNKSIKGNKMERRLKIPPENEPFIWLMLIKGETLQATVDVYRQTFGIGVTPSGIQKHRDRNLKKYEAFRDAWYAGVKEEPIANSRMRVVELWRMAEKLRKSIDTIFTYEPRQWQDLNVTSLMAEFRRFIDQIRDEVGDKVRQAEIPSQPVQNYFGDVTVHAFADQALKARREEAPVSRNRFEESGLLDSRDSLPSS